MNVLGMEEWRKVRRNNKWKVARPNDKLAVGARVVFNKKSWTGQRGRKAQMPTYCFKGSSGAKGCTTHPLQGERESGYVW